MTNSTRTLARPSGLLAVLVVASLGMTGCSGLLDVKNPNNIKQEDLEEPTGATAAVNGGLATLTRGIGAIWGPYATVTDEATWIGSRDAWGELDRGTMDNPLNEFTDNAFTYVAEMRWMTHEAVRLLEGFDGNGELNDRTHLARAYLYAAIADMTIADMFDDFAFSDRTEAAQPIGEANMGGLYDDAVAWLTSALSIAQTAGATELGRDILATRARAYQAKAIWAKVHPGAPNTADPLVSDANADADAAAILGDLGTTADWAFQLAFNTETVAIAGEVSLGYNINRRRELQVGPAYVDVDPSDKETITGIALMDPIDATPSPAVTTAVNDFIAGDVFAPYTVASTREMHLILAESALQQSDMTGFVTHINHVRSMDGLTDYDNTNPAHPAPAAMLEYERQENLFLQNRRLADLYRFGSQAPEWTSTGTAETDPGTFLPVTIIELRANCNFGYISC